jgi:RNA polymerase sigma-70 factor (ECF subfamily)
LLQVHREIIDLIYFHGKTISDAGAIEGVKQNTVKTRMLFARKRVARPLCAEGMATATA